MKRALVWTLSLAFLGCGCAAGTQEKYITGEVLERHLDENGDLTSFVMREDGGEERTFLVSEETNIITSLDDDVIVHAFKHKDPGTVHAAVQYQEEKSESSAYPALLVDIQEIYDGETTHLADNKPVNLWYRENHIYYRLENGVALLHISNELPFKTYNTPMLQEQYPISEDAAKAILAYFEKTGMRCSIPEELEKAYADYLQTTEPTDFLTHTFLQRTSVDSASQRVLYTDTCLEFYIDDDHNPYTYFGNAFDLQTGAPIPMEELFTCPPEEIGKRLLALSDVNDILKKEMEQSFSPEQIMMYDDHLEIRFPEGSLEHAATEQQVSLSYTDEVKALLQDWAIPDNGAYI